MKFDVVLQRAGEAKAHVVYSDNDAYACLAKCSELNQRLHLAKPVVVGAGPVDFYYVRPATGRALPWSPKHGAMPDEERKALKKLRGRLYEKKRNGVRKRKQSVIGKENERRKRNLGKCKGNP